MRTNIYDNGFTLWLSGDDTDNWRHKPGANWPCSTIAGRRIMVVFDDNGLVDFTLNSRDAPDDIDGNELSAIVADHMSPILPAGHPCRFVAIDQFRES